jgi:hypothetical protein
MAAGFSGDDGDSCALIEACKDARELKPGEPGYGRAYRQIFALVREQLNSSGDSPKREEHLHSSPVYDQSLSPEPYHWRGLFAAVQLRGPRSASSRARLFHPGGRRRRKAAGLRP